MKYVFSKKNKNICQWVYFFSSTTMPKQKPGYKSPAYFNKRSFRY